MESSAHERNRANNIYVLGRDFIQVVTTVGPTAIKGNSTKRTTITAEKLYETNFTEPDKKFVLILHYNGDDSYLFVNGVQELKFKTYTNEIQKNLLCLGNLSSDWKM